MINRENENPLKEKEKMATIIMWIGIIGLIISCIVTFIPIILTYIMLQKSGKTKWSTIINSNMVEIGFICFCIFTLLALGGAFCDSELGHIVLK